MEDRQKPKLIEKRDQLEQCYDTRPIGLVDLIMPRIEAALRVRESGFASEDHTIKSLHALMTGLVQPDELLKALVRICDKRAQQITYLVEDYLHE